MKREDNIYRMPTLPSPKDVQLLVNTQLIDSIKATWIQLRNIRQQIAALETSIKTEMNARERSQANR